MEQRTHWSAESELLSRYLQQKKKKLTGSGGFTDEGDQVFFDGVEGIEVVHHKHVSVAGFTADLLQLHKVHISHAHRENTVA